VGTKDVLAEEKGLRVPKKRGSFLSAFLRRGRVARGEDARKKKKDTKLSERGGGNLRRFSSSGERSHGQGRASSMKDQKE